MPPKQTTSKEEYQFRIQDLKSQIAAKTDVLNQLECSLNTMRRSTATPITAVKSKVTYRSKPSSSDVTEMIQWLELHLGKWTLLKAERQKLLDKLHDQCASMPKTESVDPSVHLLLSSFGSGSDEGSSETQKKASLLLAEKLKALSGPLASATPLSTTTYQDVCQSIRIDDAMYAMTEKEIQALIDELRQQVKATSSESVTRDKSGPSMAQMNPDFASAMNQFNKAYQSATREQTCLPHTMPMSLPRDVASISTTVTGPESYSSSGPLPPPPPPPPPPPLPTMTQPTAIPSVKDTHASTGHAQGFKPDMKAMSETADLMTRMRLDLDQTISGKLVESPSPRLLPSEKSTFAHPQSMSAEMAIPIAPKIHVQQEDPFQEMEGDGLTVMIDEDASETNSVYSGSLSSSASFSDHSPSGSASPVAPNFHLHEDIVPPPLPLKPAKISARYLSALNASAAIKPESSGRRKVLEELGSLGRVSALKGALGATLERNMPSADSHPKLPESSFASSMPSEHRRSMRRSNSKTFELSESNPFEEAEANPFEESDQFEESSPFHESEAEEYFDFHSQQEEQNPFVFEESRDQIVWPLMDSQCLENCLVGLASHSLEALIRSEELHFMKGDLALASFNSFELGDVEDRQDTNQSLWHLLAEGNAAGWALGISVKMTPVSEAGMSFDFRGRGWFPTNYIRWLPRARTETEILVHVKSQRVKKPGVRFLSLMTGEWLWLSSDAFEWIDVPSELTEDEPLSLYTETSDPLLFSPTTDGVHTAPHATGLEGWSLQPVRIEYSVGSDAQMIKQLKSQLDAAHELIATECRYLNSLMVAKEIFADRLHPSGKSDHCLTMEDWTLFFGHLDALLSVHRSLLLDWTDQTESRIEFVSNIPFEEAELEKLGTLFVKHCTRMRVYIDYCRTQMLAIQRLGELRISHPRFQSFLKDCVTNEARCRQLDLGSYLLEPMQRITRYPLLLRQLLHYTEKRQGPLLKNTNENLLDAPIKGQASLDTDVNYIDQAGLELALASAEQILKAANEAASERENALKMKSLARRLGGGGLEGVHLIGETRFLGPRRFLKEGPLRKAKSGRRLTGYLFNDFLLLAHREARKSGRGESYAEDTSSITVYRKPLRLNEIVVRDMPGSQARSQLPSSSSSSIRKPYVDEEYATCFQVVYAAEILTLMTPSASEKRQWLTTLTEACRSALGAERKKPSSTTRGMSSSSRSSQGPVGSSVLVHI